MSGLHRKPGQRHRHQPDPGAQPQHHHRLLRPGEPGPRRLLRPGRLHGRLSRQAGAPLPLTLLAGTAMAGAIGIVVGLTSLRVRHDFLAVTTMGIGFVFLGFVRKQKWLGGELGISGHSGLRPRPGDLCAADRGLCRGRDGLLSLDQAELDGLHLRRRGRRRGCRAHRWRQCLDLQAHRASASARRSPDSPAGFTSTSPASSCPTHSTSCSPSPSSPWS